MTTDPKRRKIDASDSTDTQDSTVLKAAEGVWGGVSDPKASWLPLSVASIDDKFCFNSTTYHTPVPAVIARNKDAKVVLGVDEAGRGPVLGPMVYGVAYCLEGFHDLLKSQYGFAESKELKDSVRQTLFRLWHDPEHELYKNVGWATRTMTAKDISNGMLRSVSSCGPYNLNEQAQDTTIQLIREVLAKGVSVSAIFIDTVGPPAVYQAKIQRIFPGIAITVTKKADSLFPVVSAASVAAKVTRDMNLHWFNKNMDVFKGKLLGSGYPSDPNTIKWLNESVDAVFGWPFGLLRFSWQTAKDSLERSRAAKVTYEDELIPKGGYKVIGNLMGPTTGLVNALFYARDCSL